MLKSYMTGAALAVALATNPAVASEESKDWPASDAAIMTCPFFQGHS